MSHSYEQFSGRWRLPNGGTSIGYSGNGQWKNDPRAESVIMHGPLPRGGYTIGPLIPLHPRLGKNVMALIPDATNEMFGRSEFYLHGDSLEHPGDASDGCIIQGPVLRDLVAQSPDRRLMVI